MFNAFENIQISMLLNQSLLNKFWYFLRISLYIVSTTKTASLVVHVLIRLVKALFDGLHVICYLIKLALSNDLWICERVVRNKYDCLSVQKQYKNFLAELHRRST